MNTHPILLLTRTLKNLRALHRKEKWAAWLTLMPVLAPFKWRVLLMAQAAHEEEVRYTIKEGLQRQNFLERAVKSQTEDQMGEWLVSSGLATPKPTQQ